MPGVTVTTDVRAGAGDLLRTIGSQYFVVGQTDRGPTDVPVPVVNMAEFTNKFGDIVAYGFLTDELTAYFAEGGTKAWVSRVVGASATKGTRMLVDRAGSPLNTVRLDAKNAGAWSASTTIQIEDGSVANTFTGTIVYKAGLPGEIREIFRNQATPAAFVAAVNARSVLVTATNIGSVTAAPANNPAVLAATALSAGTDDRASINSAAMAAGLDRFTAELGVGAVAIPGYDSSTVGSALQAHEKATGRVALEHTPIAYSKASAKADANTQQAVPNADGAGLFWPWVYIPDTTTGGTKLVPPTGFVAGVRARAIQSLGAWRWPAGVAGRAKFVVGVETPINRADGDDLNANFVNAIRTIGGAVELYGWRSLSADEVNFYSLAARDTLNAISYEASQVLEDLVFGPIDSRGVLTTAIASQLKGIAEGYRAVGGIYEKRADNGDLIDPGYSVTVTAIPTQRKVTAVLGVRIVEAAELIQVTIVKSATNAPV